MREKIIKFFSFFKKRKTNNKIPQEAVSQRNSQKLFAGYDTNEAWKILYRYYENHDTSLAKEVEAIKDAYNRIFQPNRVVYDLSKNVKPTTRVRKMREKIIKFFSFFKKRKTNNKIPPNIPKNVMDATKEVAYFTTFYGFFAQTSNIIKTLKQGYYTLGLTVGEELLNAIKNGFDDLIRLTTDDKLKALLQQTRDEVINSLKNHDFDNAEKAIKTLLDEVDVDDES